MSLPFRVPIVPFEVSRYVSRLDSSMINLTNVAFTVPGEPVGKGRPRATTIHGSARLYTPKKTANYEGLVALAAQTAMAGAAPFLGPLAVEIEAVHTIPASWSKKRRNDALCGDAWPTVKPDIDNIVKAIADGGNGVAWVDDKQIVRLATMKRYGATPGVWVRVAAL